MSKRIRIALAALALAALAVLVTVGPALADTVGPGV